MKPTFFLTLLASALTITSAHAQNDLKLEKTASNINILNTRFSNLPQEERISYLQLRADASRYFANKRTFETMLAIHKMREIFTDDPVADNLLGAVYVEFRDFPKARKVFRKAMERAGEDPKILFNLAELEFCDNRWESSLENFEDLHKLLISLGQENNDFVKIIEFKILLSKLALSQSTNENISADQKKKYLADAKQLADNYSYLDDSPYYYYANAALDYYNENERSASKWIITAKTVFANNPGILTSWDDTMVEFGYINAHYGKHHSKAASNTTIAP